MLKLFYRPGSCSLGPHVVLRELGLPHQLELVDRETQKTKPSGIDFRALNPKPYVPALWIGDEADRPQHPAGGELLTENAAILLYLADRKPERGLAPAEGTLERYRLIEWLHFIGTELHKGVSPLFNPKIPDDLKATFRERFFERLGIVEKVLAKQPFLMGGQLTVADVYLGVILTWRSRLGIDLAAFPATQAFFQRFAQRPAVLAAQEAEKAGP